MTAEAPARPQCEHPIDERIRESGFGTEPVACGQVVGVHTWLDVRGERHAACYRHAAARMRRYPPVDPSDPDDAAEMAHERHIRDGGDPDCRRCEASFDYWSGRSA
jgi:hypothetical protein